MEATKVWEFVHPDSLYTPSIGGAQRLPNGNTLINFGNLQWLNTCSIVTEVDSNNQIVFQLEYDYGGNLYRAQKFDWFFYSPIFGCTDSFACNYNALATLDNGSCGYNTSSYDTLSVNASIVWNGIPLNVSGNYSVTLINSIGCDSIANLNLTVATTGILDITNKNNLVNITNMLGQKTPYRKNTPLFYIYDDGTVEKRIVIE